MSAQHSISAARKRISPVGIAVALTAALAAAACAPATGQSSNDGAGAVPAAVAPSGVSAVESCAAEQRWGTDPRAGSTAMTAAPLYLVRAGQHTCYDRVVFDLNGPEAVGYAARYVPAVTVDGSGVAVPVKGRAALEVVVRGPVQGTDDQGHQAWVSLPAVGQDLVAPEKLVDWVSLQQVAFAGSFEGQTTVAVGVREQRPFRVWISSDAHYQHVVLDIAH